MTSLSAPLHHRVRRAILDGRIIVEYPAILVPIPIGFDEGPDGSPLFY